MNNGEWIRSMTDVELSKTIAKISIVNFCDLICGNACKAVSDDKCVEIILSWLKEEKKEDG